MSIDGIIVSLNFLNLSGLLLSVIVSSENSRITREAAESRFERIIQYLLIGCRPKRGSQSVPWDLPKNEGNGSVAWSKNSEQEIAAQRFSDIVPNWQPNVVFVFSSNILPSHFGAPFTALPELLDHFSAAQLGSTQVCRLRHTQCARGAELRQAVNLALMSEISRIDNICRKCMRRMTFNSPMWITPLRRRLSLWGKVYMAQFSVKTMRQTGSLLGENQHLEGVGVEFRAPNSLEFIKGINRETAGLNIRWLGDIVDRNINKFASEIENGQPDDGVNLLEDGALPAGGAI